MTFGDRLKTLRMAKKLSGAELARRAGLASLPYLYELEAGKKRPSWDVVCRLADALGVSVSKLR